MVANVEGSGDGMMGCVFGTFGWFSGACWLSIFLMQKSHEMFGGGRVVKCQLHIFQPPGFVLAPFREAAGFYLRFLDVETC